LPQPNPDADTDGDANSASYANPYGDAQWNTDSSADSRA
jgi:hypothetical protein